MKCHSIGALWFESNSIRGSNRHGLELVVNAAESSNPEWALATTRNEFDVRL